MSVEPSLVAALRANRAAASSPPFTYSWALTPGLAEDVRLRLVWADALLERGDDRGEQLLLEYFVEHAPRTCWRDDAQRLLELVMERGFVCVPDDPDEGLLAWRGFASNPYQYWAKYQDQDYQVEYGHGRLHVRCGRATLFAAPLGLEQRWDWTDADVNLYLHAASDAIRRGTGVRLPRRDDPRHRPGPYPRYRVPGGGTVGARDISRWNAVYRRLS